MIILNAMIENKYQNGLNSMANKIPKTDLEAFRRELEEDILNFNQEEARSEARSTNTPSASGRSGSSHHSHSGYTGTGTGSYHSSGHSSHRSTQSRHSSSHRTGHSSRSSSGHSSRSHRSGSQHRRKKSNKTVRILCVILAILLLLAAAGYGFLQWELNRMGRGNKDEVTKQEVNDHLDTEDLYGMGTSDAKLMNDPNITNILLIGQDRKKGDKAEMRSDAMIVCSVNSKTQEITLCSLMRDMYVPVPGYGYGMLNHTYMIGGFELLNKTIEENFGIPIEGDIEVDFEGFMGLIDLLGGVTVNVSPEEAKHINGIFPKWNLSSGNIRLTAEQALYYCRIRQNIGGDWGRTDRQRKVLTAAFNQLKSSGGKTMLNFAHQAMPFITTNLSNTKIIKYAYAMASYTMDSSRSFRLPVEGTYTQEVREETLHVLVPDLKKNAEAIQGYFYKK